MSIKFSEQHEWINTADDTPSIGITQFAVDSLGDVVYVDLPAVGTELKQFEKFGEVESVKTVSELYSPVSGEVVEVNEKLNEQPEILNVSPMDRGWLLKVKVDDQSEYKNLLDEKQYQKLVSA